MLNYARTIRDKVMENKMVVEQVKNNTKEQFDEYISVVQKRKACFSF